MKMKKLCLLIFVVIPLVGCFSKKNNTSSIIESEYEEESEIKGEDYEDIPLEFYNFISDEPNNYQITVPYQKSYFNNSTTTFQKSLALLSFGVSSQSDSKNHIQQMYEKMHFENVYFGSDYDVSPSETTIAYSIGQRQIDDYTLVLISIRSSGFKREWTNNFDVGLEGDHKGFKESALKVKTDVEKYVSDNVDTSNVKYWITGYSRGGAIANVLSTYLINENKINISVNNSFVYTFECPRALVKENYRPEYKNIFNVLNSADLITYTAPEKYGFYRSGVDIDIYSDKVDEYIKTINPGIIFPPFIGKNNKYDNDIEHAKYLLKTITREGKVDEGEKNHYIPTRSDFVNKYQESIKYLISLLFDLNDEDWNVISKAFSDLSNEEKLALKKDDNLYLFIKEQLDKIGYTYNDEELHKSCDDAKYFVSYPLSALTDELISSSSLKRLVFMHTLDIVYVLLKNYRYVT